MSCNTDEILNRGGTSQLNRSIDALDPTNFKLQDFDIEDWLIFSFNFAKHLNYFSTNDSQSPIGDWQDFFSQIDINNTNVTNRSSRAYQRFKVDLNNLLASFEKDGSLTPHLTLFVCFLKLLELSSNRFNKLTKRHLDFYYQEILQVNKSEPVSDQAHIIFELAKKTITHPLLQGTELNGGKDVAGNKRIYKTESELIANRTTVSSLKSIYNDINKKEFKASFQTNTKDGIDEDLPEDQPYFLPFGYTSGQIDYIDLPDATLGFALGSPIFNLAEGKRIIRVNIKFTASSNTDDEFRLDNFDDDIHSLISVYASGEKGWIGPLTYISFSTTAKAQSQSNNNLELRFKLEKDDPAVVNYNREVLLDSFTTDFPVVKFVIDTSKARGLLLYRSILRRNISKITTKVDVRGATNLIIENDNGVLKSNKPFTPFGTRPIVKSNFYIDYPEVFSKKWTSIKINFDWKDTPPKFADYYAGYTTPINDNNHFKANKHIKHREIWEEYSSVYNNANEANQTLFKEIISGDDHVGFECEINAFANNEIYEIDNCGPIRLSLNQSFLHEQYASVYTKAILINPDASLPKEPYTPLAENITISYSAEERNVHVANPATYAYAKAKKSRDTPPSQSKAAKIEEYENEKIRLFHIHPFGTSEEHEYIKRINLINGIRIKNSGINIKLVPYYCHGGEFYIALDGAKVNDNISLLVQVLEGSENPERTSFADNEHIEWSILCNNDWKDLKPNITGDNTNNFLKSGILSFNIPKETTSNNTILPENLTWIRAQIHRSFDIVCKLIDIHSQAVVAQVENRNNDLSHLIKGLPAETISKMITRAPQIKSVSQPYNSFGGKPIESDANFYRRISERIRHKNRTVNLWDYEHIILQAFPEIYKVKCLNHTSLDSFISPGDVTIIVIPDTINKNVFDIFQPRVSTALLNDIMEHINALNTFFVNAQVINPIYEEILISMEVQFYDGFDKNFYLKQLNTDIIKYLSPWAYDNTQGVSFNAILHRSVIINYIENLEYVDYLQNFGMKKNFIPSKDEILPSSPKSILVSAKKHNIDLITTNCAGSNTIETVECQI